MTTLRSLNYGRGNSKKTKEVAQILSDEYKDKILSCWNIKRSLPYGGFD